MGIFFTKPKLEQLFRVRLLHVVAYFGCQQFIFSLTHQALLKCVEDVELAHSTLPF